MKILLDECIDWRLKVDFGDLDVSTVKDEGWLGKKNGELILMASQSGFDVFLTIDKKLQYQLPKKSFSIAIVVLDSPLSTRFHLQKLIPKFIQQLPFITKGEVFIIQ